MELFIIRDGQQTGPFSEEIVQGMLKEGGLRPDDMGWHKGLHAWLPLSEVFQPEGKRRSEPPPVSGAQSGIRQRPATARQKALLQYVGATGMEKATREEAALAISDALENPKLTSRLARWGDEKLRLHPDLFQEEVDYRRANRIARYLELCQTEGAEVVKDVTKAHVQVLMESLDKRQVGWDQDPRAAVWDYLFPSVEEHFPQLVQDEWKGKLKFGGTSKVAAAYARVPTTAMLAEPPRAPSAIQAAIRGIVYGLVALGLVLGGMYIFKDNGKRDVTRTDANSAPESASAAAPAADATAKAPPQAAQSTEPVDPAKATADATKPPAEAAKVAPAAGEEAATPATQPASVAATASAPTVAAPAPAPAMTPESAPAAFPPPMNAPAFSTAPPPPGMVPAVPTATPEAAAGSGPAVRNSAMLTQPVTVQLQFGKVTLNPGTRIRLIAIEGANVRANFNNNIIVVPVTSTDVDPSNTVVAAAPMIPMAAPLVPAVPTAPASTPPAMSTAKPSSPSADL